jgi:predicted AAA+ superfamily ATPase
MAKSNKLNPISESLIIDRLKFENPWWISGTVEDDFAEKKRRLYFDLFQPLVEETEVRRALVLMGPRRVGKTVMMHHSIGQLLEKGISRRKICFINIENPIYNNMGLERLFSLAREAVGDSETKGWFIFFDEIQYLRDWEVHLKVLIDSYPHTKFIVSGSAAAALKVKSQESGAGRFTEFRLPPLTFNEYLYLLDLEGSLIPIEKEWNGSVGQFFRAIDIKKLNPHFIDYLNFGGYPEVVFSEKIRANPGRYIRGDIVDKVLLRDLPSLYGIQDVQELNSLFTTLAYHTGEEVSLASLSQASGVEKYQLKRYLEYLESAFLIRTIHRVDQTAKKFRRVNFFKIYLTNPSIRSALFSPLQATDEKIGNMVETAIFAQWLHREWFTPYYARWDKGEVDMIGLNKNLKPSWALEIKWSDRFYNKPGELKSLLSFCQKNKLGSAMITTIEKEGVVSFNEIDLDFVPAATYAYAVGNNTLRRKSV